MAHDDFLCSPEELLRRLQLIFPDFSIEPDELDDSSVGCNHHRVMQEFLQFWGVASASGTEQQIAALAQIINDAVEQGGELANAVDTCFLEHLSQVRSLKSIKKHLSPAAKSMAR